MLNLYMRHVILKIISTAVIIFLCIFTNSFSSYAGERVKITIFPVNDISNSGLDLNIKAALEEELSGFLFIETVPPDKRYFEDYEIKPLYLWTEIEGGEKNGGIIWNINPEVIEQLRIKSSVKYSIYGDLSQSGMKSKLNLYITKTNQSTPEKTFKMISSKKEEFIDQIPSVAGEIGRWIKREWVVREGEDYIRRYLGNIDSRSVVIGKLQNFAAEFPTSLQIQAMLLDMYLKEKEENSDHVLKTGLKIIELYDPQNDDDTRYLLSLSMDPFDIVAREYEKKKGWVRAINTRKTALQTFPYKLRIHRNGLGKDYYHYARSFELSGEEKKAIEHFNNALDYLSDDSDYYKKIKERLMKKHN